MGDMSICKMHSRPSVAVLQLRLICLFCVNLVVSSWCWTWPTLKTWNRFIKKYVETQPFLLLLHLKYVEPSQSIFEHFYSFLVEFNCFFLLNFKENRLRVERG